MIVPKTVGDWLQALRAAKVPEDVFPAARYRTGADAMASVEAAFRTLTREIHPDRNGGSHEAHEAMAILNTMRDEAERRIASGAWGRPDSGVVVATASRKYADVHPLCAGDVCDVYTATYDGGKHAVIKVAREQRDRDLMQAEAATLVALHKVDGDVARGFQRYLPKIIESASLKVGGAQRPANVFEMRQGGYTVAQVAARYARGGLDPRHVAWIWKRALEALWWVHQNGYVHGAVALDHMLVYPRDHGGQLVDWCYSGLSGRPLRAVPSGRESVLAPEIYKKAPATPGSDLHALAKSIMSISSPHPTVFRSLAHACALPAGHRYADAGDVLEQLRKHLRALYGPARFIPLEM